MPDNIINNSIPMGLLRFSGDATKQLLQGQLTCNLDELQPGQLQLAAHCNPQGRVISLFYLFCRDNHYFLQMPRELIPIAQQALKKYAVFFKVVIDDVSEEYDQLKPADSGLPEERCKAIQAKIPVIYPETSEKFLPHELDLPKLGAVSFNKGCYTGQEIIARMQYRGKLKKHLYHATVTTPLPIQRGADIYLQGNSAGSIVDYCQLGYNQYLLLVIAHEDDIQKNTFSLDQAGTYTFSTIE